jgi:hypothetical protein
MSRPHYPRQGFAKYLGNDKALLDYLALIADIKVMLEQLIAALPDQLTGALLTESGEFLLTEGGDTLLLET